MFGVSVLCVIVNHRHFLGGKKGAHSSKLSDECECFFKWRTITERFSAVFSMSETALSMEQDKKLHLHLNEPTIKFLFDISLLNKAFWY